MRKFYKVTLILQKSGEDTELFNLDVGAKSEEEALKLSLNDSRVSECLILGYKITSKAACLYSEGLVPANSESAFSLSTDLETKELIGLFINLRNQYSEDFKRDLQKFLSKYSKNLPVVFKKYA